MGVFGLLLFIFHMNHFTINHFLIMNKFLVKQQNSKKGLKHFFNIFKRVYSVTNERNKSLVKERIRK